MKGIIKSWNGPRGYGFIAVDGGGDTFVHISEVDDNLESLAIGDMVTFDLDTGRDGRKCATNVRVLD